MPADQKEIGRVEAFTKIFIKLLSEVNGDNKKKRASHPGLIEMQENLQKMIDNKQIESLSAGTKIPHITVEGLSFMK